MDEETASAIAALTQHISELEKQLERAHPTRWNGAEGAIGAPGVRIHPSCKIIASGGRTVRFGERVLLRRGAEIVGPAIMAKAAHSTVTSISARMSRSARTATSEPSPDSSQTPTR